MRVLDPADEAAIVEAMHALDAGQLVAYPESTGYLLGADALDDAALEHLREVRALPADRAVPVLVADLEEARHVARVTMTARRIAAHGLPDGVLLVLPAMPTAPDALLGGGDTVAIHVATHDFARALAGRFGPVAATRAAGCETPAAVGERYGGVALAIDGGNRPSRAPTVIDATSTEGRILKEGHVPANSVTL